MQRANIQVYNIIQHTKTILLKSAITLFFAIIVHNSRSFCSFAMFN